MNSPDINEWRVLRKLLNEGGIRDEGYVDEIQGFVMTMIQKRTAKCTICEGTKVYDGMTCICTGQRTGKGLY